jgi:hypothetical protein
MKRLLAYIVALLIHSLSSLAMEHLFNMISNLVMLQVSLFRLFKSKKNVKTTLQFRYSQREDLR